MRANRSLAAILALLIVAGCSRQDGLKLAPASGTVSYQGRPLADAVVMFAPDEGPLALGTTDLDGRFTLSTGNRRGVSLGPSHVAVNMATPEGDSDLQAPAPARNAEEAQAYLEKAGQMQQALNERGGQGEARSVIPAKYTRPDTSGLTFTVKAKGGNKFDIKLE